MISQETLRISQNGFWQFPSNYVAKNFPKFVSELQQFVRFPSISTEPKFALNVKNCADWLANHLQKIGLQKVQIFETKRHPIVYAEWLKMPDKPTLLIYGHYDVQPIEPLEKWQENP